MLHEPIIVVIGAGRVGIRAIEKLALTNAEIVLIERNNYYTFVPLLYYVATGFILSRIVAIRDRCDRAN